ncbi:MAG: hypothetical protein LBG12_01020 [Synergistaceae bacterium]|nr:hypothetical protein [Synergistaceae bacterium]
MYCNNCGYPKSGERAACGACGRVMSSEPHISDVTSGNVVICGACAGANLQGSVYCRECGSRLSAAKIPMKDDVAGAVNFTVAERQDVSQGDGSHADNPEDARAASYETYPSSGDISSLPSILTEPRKSLLENLGMMERELEAKKEEPLPEPDRNAEADKLDEYDETLKNIAFRLDTLISDLLKAEAQEYAFSDSTRVDEKNFGKKREGVKREPFIKRFRNIQYVIVLIALIVAIFLVGMTFGLWGSYFFGI